jgi:hypothetical protein
MKEAPMTSRLSSQALDQLTPLLGSLARLGCYLALAMAGEWRGWWSEPQHIVHRCNKLLIGQISALAGWE